MIEYLWRGKQPYNVSVAAEVAALAALTNKAYLDQVRDALVEERERLFSKLKEVPYLEPYPSSANFILCKVTQVGRCTGLWHALPVGAGTCVCLSRVFKAMLEGKQ